MYSLSRQDEVAGNPIFYRVVQGKYNQIMESEGIMYKWQWNQGPEKTQWQANSMPCKKLPQERKR